MKSSEPQDQAAPQRHESANSRAVPRHRLVHLLGHLLARVWCSGSFGAKQNSPDRVDPVKIVE